MANVTDIKNGICDEVFVELEAMKDKLAVLREKVECSYPAEDTFLGLQERHLYELAEQIEWRLQILSHACPYDWKGSADFEDNIVSVGPAEKFDTDFSGGYIGG
jgi:hypothetical protein